MSEQNTAHCGTCRFCFPRFNQIDGVPDSRERCSEYGMCKRNPPQVINIGDGSYTSAFPQTPLDDWCGAFESEPTVEVAAGFDEPECPGPGCTACSGEHCAQPGCELKSWPECGHEVTERHGYDE